MLDFKINKQKHSRIILFPLSVSRSSSGGDFISSYAGKTSEMSCSGMGRRTGHRNKQWAAELYTDNKLPK